MVWQPCCWESFWSSCGNEMIMMLILFLLCRWDDRDDHGQAKQAAKMLDEVLQDQPSQVWGTNNIINLDSSFREEYLLRLPKNVSLNEQNILRSPGWIQIYIWPLSSIYCTEYWQNFWSERLSYMQLCPYTFLLQALLWNNSQVNPTNSQEL